MSRSTTKTVDLLRRRVGPRRVQLRSCIGRRRVRAADIVCGVDKSRPKIGLRVMGMVLRIRRGIGRRIGRTCCGPSRSTGDLRVMGMVLRTRRRIGGGIGRNGCAPSR